MMYSSVDNFEFMKKLSFESIGPSWEWVDENQMKNYESLFQYFNSFLQILPKFMVFGGF